MKFCANESEARAWIARFRSDWTAGPVHMTGPAPAEQWGHTGRAASAAGHPTLRSVGHWVRGPFARAGESDAGQASEWREAVYPA